MKCEQCIKEDKKSKINIKISNYITTQMPPDPWYDEDGKFHYYKWESVVLYRCSNGHEWKSGAGAYKEIIEDE